MDPLRAALAPPPDSKDGLARLRAVKAAWLRDYRALRRRGDPRAASVLLALDPVLILDAGFDVYAGLLEEALPLAAGAGPRVHAGLLRAHARIWTLHGGHRVARRAISEARAILPEAALAEEPIAAGMLAFGAAHIAHGLGLAGEVERETRAIEALAASASGTPAALRLAALASKANGFVAMIHGAHAAAVDAFERSIDWARRAGAERTLAIGLANRGFALRDQGEPERAASSLLEGLALFRSLGDRRHACMVESALVVLPRGRVPLDVAAVLRAASAAEEVGDARSAAGLLLALVERAGRSAARAEAAGWLDRAWGLLARIDAPALEAQARRLTEVWGAAAGPHASILEVAGDGTLARLDGRVIDLRTRRALPRVLLALVHARLGAGGAYLSVAEVFAAGWPGEKALPHAAAARVYMAVRALRALGLHAAIATSPAGYRIEPEIAVRLGETGAAGKASFREI